MTPSPAPQQSLLDRLLTDLTPEQRARVLDLVVLLDLDPQDPLFLILVAIGQLKVLIDETPTSWGYLFSAFEADLAEWKTQNLHTLENLSLEAEAVQALSQHALTLSEHVNELQSVLKQLIEALESSEQATQSWQSSFGDLKRDLLLSLSTLTPTPSAPPSVISPPASRWSRSVSLLTLLILTITGLGLVPVYHRQLKQGQQLEWLIDKENRRDCRDGILPASDPLCP